MGSMTRRMLLTINSGSSSMKFAMYGLDESARPVLSGKLDSTGMRVLDAEGAMLLESPLELKDRDRSTQRLFDWFRENGYLDGIVGVGYRIVHGGPRYKEPVLIDLDVINELRRIIALAPDHLPDQIATVEHISKILPDVPAVACFDTSFHRTMPRYAQVFGLPLDLEGEGVIRYGFHGLSYAFIVDELRKQEILPERLIVAHLGNGASMAAIRNGKSIDTSMGLTPTGGFLMSNRSGDLDPGVMLYLLRERKMTVDQVADLVNQGGGLKGLSGISGDMRTLEKESPRSVFVFCYQVRKFLGAYMAALGGLDMLVFTGGIGENSAMVRNWICADMQRLGISIDARLNERGEGLISAADSTVPVRVMKTNEEVVIARYTRELIARGP
jgi:acetate kinase